MTDSLPPETLPAAAAPVQVAPRDRLIAASIRLFRRQGINATGIDAIVAEAGTAKTTLYKLFGSKSELVEAVLRSEGREWRDRFGEALAQAEGPRAKLDSIFPLLKRQFRDKDYSGSVFSNAVGEHDQKDVRLRAVALQHKSLVVTQITALAAEAGARKPDALAQQIWLLMDGAMAAAMVSRDPAVADVAGAAAGVLIDSACAVSRTRRPRRRRLQGGAAALAKEELSEAD